MEALRLSNAQASWKLGEKWKVYTPQGEMLFEFEGKHDEKTVMEAIHLGRTFEVEAFNKGIAYGKEIAIKLHQDKYNQLSLLNQQLMQKNSELANALLKHINKQ